MTDRPGVGLLLSRLRARERQQSAIAILGQHALSGLDVEDLGKETLGLVSQALKATHVRLLIADGEGGLEPVAALGGAPVPHGPGSPAFEAFHSGVALRAEWPELLFAPLGRPAVRLGCCHPVPGEDEPLGVLEVGATAGRELNHDEQNFLASVCGILSQAIRRIRREKALQTSEALLQSTLDTLGDSIAILDVDGRILDVNGAWRRLCAALQPDLPRHGVDCSYPGLLQVLGAQLPEQAARVRRDVEEVLSGARDDLHVDFPIGSGAETRWIHLRMKTFSCGSVTRILATHSDITERRKAEQALQESEEQLRHAMKMEAVGRLAGGIAHDFNNLLTAILGYANLLSGPGGHAVEILEIRKAAESARELTRQLLGFSRKGISQLEAVELNEVLAGLGEILRRIIGEDVELELDLEAGSIWLEADRGQIEQILLNLAVNARDAMPGGGRLTILTRRKRLDLGAGQRAGLPPGSYVELEVRDTGNGMDEETCGRIFEPYFTTKGPGQGSGLGLSIVYGILRRHLGRIHVESAPGKGSSFRILLPEGKGTRRKIRAVAPGEASGGDESILLVEDEASIRRLARRILEERGYRVLEACDGGEALDLLEAGDASIDLVVTDVVMPRMTGPELVRRLQLRYPEVRVLYISGYAETTILREGMVGCGAVLLEKPFTPLDLVRKVREQLDASTVVVA